MDGILVDDLKAKIAAGKALLIVGAGVSVAVTKDSPLARVASWTGLLADGIDRCLAVGRPRPDEDWARRKRAELDSGDLDDLLSVAELVAKRLGAPVGGEYSRWLRDTVGSLQATDRAALDGLRALVSRLVNSHAIEPVVLA